MSSKKQYEEQVAAKLKQLESEVDALRDHIKSIEHRASSMSLHPSTGSNFRNCRS